MNIFIFFSSILHGEIFTCFLAFFPLPSFFFLSFWIWAESPVNPGWPQTCIAKADLELLNLIFFLGGWNFRCVLL